MGNRHANFCLFQKIWHGAARALAMISRTRFLITLAWLCHLLLTPALVTSQSPPPPSARQGEPVLIKADEQERDGSIYKLNGHVEIHYRDLILWADHATYNDDTAEATADGHVVLDGSINEEHITASHARYNVDKETGVFYDAVGTIGAKPKTRSLVLTSPHPFAFTARVVDKTGPDHYIVHHGTVTTCELPHPKWQFNSRRVSVEVGKDAVLYNSMFRVRGVPVFFFPFATHPLEKLPRQSGFLIPSYGHSTIKGYVFGDSFYWAINRSMDATIGAQLFTLRGWAQHAEFRARPNDHSNLYLTYFGVMDRGTKVGHVDQGGENVRLQAESRFQGFRAVANIDYLTSYIFRLVFYEVFTQAVFSEVRSQAFLSKTSNGFSYNALLDHYQNFESARPHDVITILHEPSFDVSSVDRRLGHSPFYWSFDSAFEGLHRSEPPAGGGTSTQPAFVTAPIVGRFDFSPTLSLPLHSHGWSAWSELGVRSTLYTQRLIPSSGGVGIASNQLTNRKALDASVEIRPPSVERIFAHPWFGYKIKHVVEPRVIYRRTTGIDNFDNILRFDSRDILSDTNEIEYGLVNRFYGKPLKATQNCRTTETVTPSTTTDNPSAPRTSTERSDAAADQDRTDIQNAPQSTAEAPIPWQTDEPPSAQLPDCAVVNSARELFSWELGQKYFFDPSFGGAVVNGFRNVFATTADFTGIAFLTGPRRFAPLISRFRLNPGGRVSADSELDYDFARHKISTSSASLSVRIGQQLTLSASDAYIQAPGSTVSSNNIITPILYNNVRFGATYGSPLKRGFSTAGIAGYDANTLFLQYTAVQSSYNWDCCGVSVEYRRWFLPGIRNENEYRFIFNLANVGSFGNLRRRERLY
jgi:LPS-assembly protein